MVVFNTGLLIGLVCFLAGAVTTLALVLLVVVYHNTVGSNDKKDDEEDHSFIIPMSQIPGGGGMGGYSQADVARAAAMVRAATAAGTASPEETKKASVGDGNYI